MVCCQCQGIETTFDKHRVARSLKRYRAKGPTEETQLLIDALKSTGVAGTTVLDIGGGIGALQHELLAAGAAEALSVEASAAYLEMARQEAARRGFGDRIGYHHGDFADVAGQLPMADIVTLDRVICCYHDVHTLVGLSAAKARQYYAVVFPRDTWGMRVFALISNFFMWLKGNPFRIFIHPSKTVETLLEERDFTRTFYRKTRRWQVAVYRRREEH